jgi:hypothetical protein
MLRIDFRQEDVDKLHHERYHHPHPLVGSFVSQNPGIKHQDICNLCKISKTTLTKYIKQYQLGSRRTKKTRI